MENVIFTATAITLGQIALAVLIAGIVYIVND